ncbi:WD40/YVTN/BNR-like repeat-containing protein [Acanthopleuribacter pedis]|uniref:Sortilin N-terminal domain-containing protein n=1 Tax=Acanthopleuribacter pedis TaxID=442870 RepID=A0A8J7U6D3_9BACT|nr:hypothetical protein [Acanthopleuribacter pedis]MBO1321794.1 hypothetical protein [Acanthopleuribacter pedis]
MKKILATVLAGLSLSGLVSGQVPTIRTEPGAKLYGEEEQIKARKEWFAERRGLKQMPDANTLWREAVAETKAAELRARFYQPGQVWVNRGPNSMTMLNWAMGRVAGRVSAFAYDPTDAQKLYLGTASGGLWISDDDGINWTSVFDGQGTQSIGSLKIQEGAPGQPNIIWAGTGEQGSRCSGYSGIGLLKSMDGGQTWQDANGSGEATLNVTNVTAIELHPTQPDVILAGGERFCQEDGSAFYGGLYRSADAGATWTRVLNTAVNDIIADPENPGTFYTVLGRWGNASDGVYKSTDGGINWDRLESTIPFGETIGRARLAMAPSDSSILYLLANVGSETPLYRTNDGGDTWALVNADACTGQCSYNLCIAVHPTNPDEILVGTLRVARSTDGGPNLAEIVDGWGSSQTVHQDTHVVRYDLRAGQNGDRYWVGSDGGLWRTDDAGANYANLNDQLNITQFYDIAVHPDQADHILGGAQDNSSARTVNNLVWEVTVVTGDGFTNLFDPLDPNVVFQTSYPFGGTPSIVRSTTGGAPRAFQWLPMTGVTPNEPTGWVLPMDNAVMPGNQQTGIFIGTNRIYRSVDQGDTWTGLGSAFDETRPIAFVVSTRTGDNIVAMAATQSSNRIFISRNADEAAPVWTEITSDYPGGSVTDMALDPNDDQRIYLTRGGFNEAQFYRSDNGGTNWTPMGTGLPNVPANTVAVDPLQAGRVFVGNDIGVFVSVDSGQNFEPFMPGLPMGVMVTDLEIDDNPYWLTLGSYGRGAWQIALTARQISVEGQSQYSLCRGYDTALPFTVNGASGQVTYNWRISSGPDTDLAQFSATDVNAPNFTANAVGDYSLICDVNDGGLTAEFVVNISVAHATDRLMPMTSRWMSRVGDAEWQAQDDRVVDNVLNVLDLIDEANSGTCN